MQLLKQCQTTGTEEKKNKSRQTDKKYWWNEPCETAVEERNLKKKTQKKIP